MNEFLRDFNWKNVLDNFEKILHPFLYKRTLATMQIKEAGFNDIVNIWPSKMVWIPCRRSEKTESYVEVFSTLNISKQEKMVKFLLRVSPLKPKTWSTLEHCFEHKDSVRLPNFRSTSQRTT